MRPLRISGGLSIKRKLVGIILGTSLAVLTVACGALLVAEILGSRQATARSLSAIADIVAENSSAALIFDDRKTAQEIISGLRVEPEIARAALFNQAGAVVATYPQGFMPAPAPRPAGDEVLLHLAEVTLYKPVLQGDHRVGTVFIQGTLQGTYRRIGAYGLVLLAVMGFAVGVAFLLSTFFQRLISEPLLNLAKTAGVVSADQNYSVRATKMSNDELGVLTDAFNAMLDQIEGAQAELLRARDDAVRAARAKDDFLAALSHELRTPLSPVLLLASDAADNPAFPPEAREQFAIVQRNVELEARLIDDLLDLTSITRGKLVLSRKLVAIPAVLADALATVQPDIRAKGIQVALDLAAGQPEVMGDPIRLQQVFWNVLKNAAKFTPQGGTIGVAMRVVPEMNEVAVTISDSGIGMTPDEIARIFDAFSQGDHAAPASTHRFGGLGLGLAISRSVIGLHSGRIAAKSGGRNQGSAFVITLPLARVGGPAGAAPAPGPVSGPGRPAAFAAASWRILLVEDHAPTRNAIASLLQRRGYGVVSAGSLAEARAAAAGGGFQILISDIGLPDGTGNQLIRELKASHRLVGIAITGYGMEEDIRQTMQAGFLVHLTKPIQVDALEEAMARALAAALP